MTMGKKDFETTAACIADTDYSIFGDARAALKIKTTTALNLADVFCALADTFDPTRFVRACGVPLTSSQIAAHSTRLRLRISSLRK